MNNNKLDKLEAFKKRSLDASNSNQLNRNILDEDHTLLWQMVGFAEKFNIMATMMLDKKANKFNFNYRFAYPNGEKSWHHLTADKNSTEWNDVDAKLIEDGKRAMREMLEEINKHEPLKIRELEFTGKETLDEVMERLQSSGLVNLAKVDKKKKTVEVLNEEDFDQLNLD